MEQYKDDYVDVKRPEDDSYSFRSRQYCQYIPCRVTPLRVTLTPFYVSSQP